jgi:hypothetical protein
MWTITKPTRTTLVTAMTTFLPIIVRQRANTGLREIMSLVVAATLRSTTEFKFLASFVPETWASTWVMIWILRFQSAQNGIRSVACDARVPGQKAPWIERRIPKNGLVLSSAL